MPDKVDAPKRGFEIKPLTFKGRHWRCQLMVSDYQDGVIESWKDKPVTFCVSRLPVSAHPATAFITGEQIYYGRDFALAVADVEKSIGRLVWPHEFPKDWYRYKHPDSQEFRDKLEAIGMEEAERCPTK